MSTNRTGPPPRQPLAIREGDIAAILSGHYPTIVRVADQLARALRNIRRAQIRKVYSDLVQIGCDPRLVLLQPRLAYAAARQGRDYETLTHVFTRLLDRAAEDETVYQYVRDFAEALVAYHTVYAQDGRDERR